MNAKDRLRAFIRNHPSEHIKTSEIIRWGANGGYSNRAARNARELANQGILERLPRGEAILSGFSGSEGIYKINKEKQ